MDMKYRAGSVFEQILIGALLAVTVACAAAPRSRPVKMGDVDTSSGTTEFVRRQLAGRWQLTTLTIYSATGQATNVPADAEMTYDDFGNLNIRGQLKTGTPGDIPPILRQSGRAVIDAQKHQLRLMETEGDAITQRPVSDAIDVDHVRLYEFTNQGLTLTTVDAAGKKTAAALWRKIS